MIGSEHINVRKRTYYGCLHDTHGFGADDGENIARQRIVGLDVALQVSCDKEQAACGNFGANSNALDTEMLHKTTSPLSIH